MKRFIPITQAQLESQIDLLRHYLEAIQRWQGASQSELDARQASLESMNAIPEYDSDEVAYAGDMIKATCRLMYATLAVSLSAVAENFLRSACLGLHNTKLRNRIAAKERSDWGYIQRKVESISNIKYNGINHFEAMHKVRVLNNCFKHNRGRINKLYAKNIGGSVGDQIEYEKENWETIISECHAFLDTFVSRLGHKYSAELASSETSRRPSRTA